MHYHLLLVPIPLVVRPSSVGSYPVQICVKVWELAEVGPKDATAETPP